jgi:arylsulfatase A
MFKLQRTTTLLKSDTPKLELRSNNDAPEISRIAQRIEAFAIIDQTWWVPLFPSPFANLPGPISLVRSMVGGILPKKDETMNKLPILLAAWVLGSWAYVASAIAQDRPPNVVLILADDMGVFDLACYGRSDHRTPNLDRLCAEGIKHTSAYCGLPICSASRASLLTSKFPARLHLTTYLPGRADAPSQRLLQPEIEPALIPSAQTLAEVLKRSGYATGIFGKWHLGGGSSSPLEQGFDVSIEPSGNGDPLTSGGKNENLITDKAIEFIKAHSDKPYFCYVPHHSPHIMLSAQQSKLDRNAQAWNPLYASVIESLDESIGRLLSAIDESGQAANTIVLFSSDNGGLHVPEGHPTPATYNGTYRAGKGYLYEGGLRVPLLVRWPSKIARDRTIDAPVSLMDLMPTVLEAAGIETGKSVGPIDGQSQLAAWTQAKNPAEDRAFYWHLPHYTNQGSKPSGAVRRGNWKWVEDYETQSGELFDLSQDLSERNNLAKSQPEVAAQMHQLLIGWKTSLAAQECLPNPQVQTERNAELYIDQNASLIDGRTQSAQQIADAWAAWRSSMNKAIEKSQPKLKKTPSGITLLASESKTHGKRIRYEPETFKNVVGYWTEVDDWVEWSMDVPKTGTYRVELHCGCGSGNGGSMVDVQIENPAQTLEWKVRDTGHFQNIVIEPIGQITLQAGTGKLRIKPKTKAAAAVADIREIHLIPVGE